MVEVGSGQPVATRLAAGSLVFSVGRHSASETEEHEDRATEADEFLVAESADRLAELGARHGRDLVDHEAARLPQPVHVVWLDPKPEQRGFGRIGREGAHRDRVRTVKAIVLDYRNWSWLADVLRARYCGPDLPALQSSSRLTASMNA